MATRLTFRPALGATIFTAIGTAILLALGGWQLARLDWKTDLIAEFTARAHSRPLPISAIDPSAPPRFQRVTAQGQWLHAYEVQLTGRVFDGTPGYHIITPFRLGDGRLVLVNRGWVPEDLRLPQSRRQTLSADTNLHLDAILRLPQTKPWLVPANMPASNDWFTLLIPDLQRHITQQGGAGNQLITSFSLEAIRHGRGLPIGSRVDADIGRLRNNHLQYALTWFGLAVALLAVYFVWHKQQGRLRFG